MYVISQNIHCVHIINTEHLLHVITRYIPSLFGIAIDVSQYSVSCNNIKHALHVITRYVST